MQKGSKCSFIVQKGGIWHLDPFCAKDYQQKVIFFCAERGHLALRSFLRQGLSAKCNIFFVKKGVNCHLTPFCSVIKIVTPH